MTDAERVKAARAGPVTVKLAEPIQWGQETIEELTIKPTAKAFRGFALKVGDDGISYEPYTFASLGIRMAGHPNAVVDKLSIVDMVEIAQVVLGFFAPGQVTGSESSP